MNQNIFVLHKINQKPVDQGPKGLGYEWRAEDNVQIWVGGEEAG
jgi:hypothetical protein